MLASLFWQLWRRSQVDHDRVYKIGYGGDIPFHFQDTNGQPAGMAVELVREAAARRGIKLEWALNQGIGAGADFWVLLTFRPDRTARYHFTAPFVQSYKCFLVPANSPAKNEGDLLDARISFLDFDIHRKNLANLVPRMRPLPVKTGPEALAAVASGRADAAYFDEYSAFAALLSGGSTIPLRWIPARLPKSQMGLASNFAAARAAEEIRREIDAMVLDGTVAKLGERWPAFPNLTSDLVQEVVLTRKGIRFLREGVLILSVLLLGTVWLTIYSRRQTRLVRQKERRHEALLQSAIDGFRCVDNEGRLLEVNDAYCHMSGFSREELLTLKVSDLEVAEASGLVEKIRNQGHGWFESRHRRKDGTVFDIEVSVQKENRPDGLFYAFLRDITERKRAETSLRRSEERFRTVADYTSNWETWITPDGRTEYVSPSCLRITGYSRDEFNRDAGLFHTIVHPEDRPAVVQQDESVRKERMVAERDFRIVTKSGEIRWISRSCQAVYTEVGEYEGIRASHRDITDRKQAEEMMKRLNRELKALNACNVAMVRARDEEALLGEICRIICEVADYRMAWVGFAADDERKRVVPAASGGWVDGYLDQVDISWDDTPAGRGPTGTCIRTGEMCYVGDFANDARTLPWREAALQRGYCSSISLPLGDERGRTFGALTIYAAAREAFTGDEIRLLSGLADDLAFGIMSLRGREQRKQLEVQLIQAQKLEAVGQLAGGVAHDFNNILAATMMNLDLLRVRTDLNGEVRETLAELMNEAQRAAALTRQLLLFSRRSQLEIKTLDPNDVVGGMLKMLKRLIGEHIAMSFEPNLSVPMVRADSGMIEQVLMNLVVNARDAMPQGGRLSIALEAVEADRARLKSHPELQPGWFVCLSVKDTGCGMDEATLKRIFEPFFTTKEVGKGTGLGLATVYGIVGQHNGWIEVESAPGQGSAFRVFLPAAAQPSAPAKGVEKQEHARGSETILLVEDEEILRRVTARGLTRLGYTVIEAASGREALEVWQANRQSINLLLSDMIMPDGVSGLDLVEKIRQADPTLKAIIASGYSSTMLPHELLTARRITRLQKPVSLQELSVAVRSVLDGVEA